MTLSLSSTMSWLCSCILFSIFLDYIFLCTIMLRILWTGDRRKRLLFLNILACYCQFIMSYGILWRDDEDQTLLVRVIWQTSAKLLSLSWQQLVVEKAFESSVWKPKGVKRRHSLPGKTEINHYVDSAGLCDMLICFLSLSLLPPNPIRDFFNLSVFCHSRMSISNYYANNSMIASKVLLPTISRYLFYDKKSWWKELS